jgi:AIR synthase-related protein
MEGFIAAFVETDPWFAGWCGVMVNLSDIAAMGGRALAVCDTIWANGEAAAAPVLEGLAAAAAAYQVPIVGGHTNLSTKDPLLSVAVLGRAKALLTSFDARPGDLLLLAADHRGAYREPFNHYQAALSAPHERLRADLALLPRLAEAGLCRAAKDVSQAGIVGTAAMLAETSGVAIEIDLEAIRPPPGVTLARWLKTFPSFGFVLSIAPPHVEGALELFQRRELHAAVVGEVREGEGVTLRAGALRAPLREGPLMGFAPARAV